MTKTVILLGSSRSKGNTYKIVQQLMTRLDADLIDLNEYTISPYDYESKNRGDDFLPLIKRIADDYDRLIVATPVYWYTMSATLKIFFDRLSDCIRIEKETGRKLRGKSLGALCCGSEAMPTPAFFTPIKMSADYLGMNYIGDVHTWISDTDIEEDVKDIINDFASQLV